MSETGPQFLEHLERLIAARRATPTAGSYTAALFAAGPARIAQKIGEEAVELAIASISADRDQVVNEAADLLYHLLVLLSAREITLAAVSEELARRHETASQGLRSPPPQPAP